MEQQVFPCGSLKMLLVNAGIILAFFLSLWPFWRLAYTQSSQSFIFYWSLRQQRNDLPGTFSRIFSLKKGLKNIEDEELDQAMPKELPISNDVNKASTNQFPVFLFVFILLISSAIMFAVDSWLGLLVSSLISLILFQRASSYN